MKTMTAGNLKNKTGEAMKAVSKDPLRSMEESWEDGKEFIGLGFQILSPFSF